MKLRTVASFGAFAAVLLLPTAVFARSYTIPYPTLGTTGEEVFGPATIHITQINAFRYAGVLVTDKHTLSAPPDIFKEITSTGSLSPSLSGASTANQLNALFHLDLAATPAPARIPTHTAKAQDALTQAGERIDDIRSCTDSEASDVLTIVQSADPGASRNDSSYKKQIEDLLNGAKLKQMRADLGTCVGQPLAARWPRTLLRTAQNEILTARALHEDKDASIKDLLKTLDDERTALQPVSSADVYAAISKQYEALRTWSVVFDQITSYEQFHVDKDIGCPNRFKADSVLISIDAYDRTVSDEAKSKQTKEIKTVDCPSALSLSHGFGYSNIPLQSFKVGSAFVSGASGTTIQNDRKDSGRPYLMTAIGHYEIWRGDPVSLHLSLSATTSQSAIAGGMVGLSLSFHRALYVTAGIFRSDVESLQNGYAVGQNVPSSLSLSTTKNAVNRFGMAISFPIIKGESGTPTTTRGADQGNGQPVTGGKGISGRGGGSPGH